MGRAQDTDQTLVTHRVAPKEWKVVPARQRTIVPGGLPSQARAWALESNESTLPCLARRARKKAGRHQLPPAVAVEPQNDWIARNNAWLRAHRHEYRGNWVALRAGVLLGADTSRVALHRRLEKQAELAGAAFARL